MAGLPDVNLEVQVIQSDCDVTANCGKSIFIHLNAFIKPNFQLVALFVKMFCSVHDTKKKKMWGVGIHRSDLSRVDGYYQH